MGDTGAEDFLPTLAALLDGNSDGSSQRLEIIPQRLAKFERQGLCEVCENALSMLGTVVGKQKSWQNPFSTSGILEYSLENLKPGRTTVDLAKQHLRIVGNSVADNDDNRAVALNSLEVLVDWIDVEELTITALGAVFNLCNDFDAGKDRAAKFRLDGRIAHYIAKNKIPEDGSELASFVILLTRESLSKPEHSDETSIATFSQLLNAILPFDREKHTPYLGVCAIFFANKDLIERLAISELDKLFTLLLRVETSFQLEDVNSLFKALDAEHNSTSVISDLDALDISSLESQEDDELDWPITDSTSHLINCIGAMAATDAFRNQYNLESPLIKEATSRILSSSITPSTICACVLLGNIATTDEVSIQLVKDIRLHGPLIHILEISQEPALLFAAAGLVRHLAFPTSNREPLGQTQLINTCCHLLINKNPAVRGEAAGILRKLVTNNIENITRIVREETPVDIRSTDDTPGQHALGVTVLHHMVSTALQKTAPLPSSTMKLASVEIGSAIAAMLSCLHRRKEQKLTLQMYEIPQIAESLTRLVRQRIYPDAKSDALLGLGVMSLTKIGASCIMENSQDISGFLGALRDLFANKLQDGDASYEGSNLSPDQFNALVILHGLTENASTMTHESLKSRVFALQNELRPFLTLASRANAPSTTLEASF